MREPISAECKGVLDRASGVCGLNRPEFALEALIAGRMFKRAGEDGGLYRRGFTLPFPEPPEPSGTFSGDLSAGDRRAGGRFRPERVENYPLGGVEGQASKHLTALVSPLPFLNSLSPSPGFNASWSAVS